MYLKGFEIPGKKTPGAMKESLDTKKHRLRKATREFESFFVLHMLKAMRKTIPKSEMLNGGLGQDIYTGMFDEELARKVAGSSPNSLSEMLYKSLEKHLEAEEPNSVGNQKANGEVSTAIDNIGRQEINKFNRPDSISTSREINNREVKINSDTEEALVYHPARITPDPVLSKYGSTIDKASREFKIDSKLIYSVIMAESGGKADAVSSKGARGLMQLVDSTAADMGVADSLNPHQNIIGGTKYLRILLDRYNGNLRLALAAYNAGPGTVSKYNGVPPYPETRQYIEDVLGRLHSAKKP
jgi:soluble lytic murein transglycosylase-like protein